MKRSLVAIAVAVSALAVGCSSGGGDDTTAAPTTTRPSGSSGCHAAARSLRAGEQKVTLTSGGVERWYLRHVPPAHDGATPLPLIVDLHGYLEGAELHARFSGLGSLGDREGFVTVTPQGSGDAVPFWNFTAGSDDVRFIGALLDDVERTVCIDARRVYATGMSNGALMTSRLACAYAGRIAAVAPVAGITDPAGCHPSRAVPVVAFHGTDDRFLPYAGGLGASALDLPALDGSRRTIGDLPEVRDAPRFPSVPDSLAAWARRNECTGDATEKKVADDITLVSYRCPPDAEVSLYRVEGGGHAWPGSALSNAVASIVGRTTMSISANDVMWAFFRAHPLGGN